MMNVLNIRLQLDETLLYTRREGTGEPPALLIALPDIVSGVQSLEMRLPDIFLKARHVTERTERTERTEEDKVLLLGLGGLLLRKRR